MAIDDVNRGGLERSRSGEHVGEEGPACERLQDLGQIRVHPLPLACGENHDTDRHAIEPRRH